MLKLIRISLLALAAAFVSPSVAQEQSPAPYIPSHPLDALTTEEIVAGVEILRVAGLASDATRYPSFALLEPPKAEVTAWRPGQPFSRRARVSLFAGGETTEAVLDLRAAKVLEQRKLPGMQPMIMDAEWAYARDRFMADPRYKAALERRGLAAGKGVFCTPNSAGYFPNEAASKRRILRIPCFSDADKAHPNLARPIEGLMGIVDSSTGDVIDVLDREVVSMPKMPAGYGADQPKPFEPMFPVDMVAEAGSNIRLSGNLQVEWFKWKFHVRADKKAGVIMSLVTFDDEGKDRLIAYQMNLSEIFVPYMDPNPTWSYRTFLDAGEFGLGYLISSLQEEVDCPASAIMVDLTFPNDIGGSYARPRALCIFERATGDPAWRHYSSGSKTVNGRPETELVVRHIPTLGNYDYIVDYVFNPRGNIAIRLGATGFDAIKSSAAADMESPTAREDTRYGSLIAPYTVAPNHDHYYSFRIDLDIDGAANEVHADHFIRETLPEASLRRSLWKLGTVCLEKEGPVKHDPKFTGGEILRIVNTGMKTPVLKNNPSYWVHYDHDVTSLLTPDDPPQMRGDFSSSAVWITRYKPEELWAAGDYPNLHPGGAGLPEFVKPAENIKGEDIVLWYTMGFRHPPRPEDYPILPTYWHEMTLRPFRFFDRDPSSRLNTLYRQSEE
jgi:primary-amine oxidase